MFAALEVLQDEGPNLGRPLVDFLQDTRIRNLKELRPASPGRTEIRIIFTFDSNHQAIMLLADDKTKGKNGEATWTKWYGRAIPQAEQLYEQHVRRLKGRGT